MVFFDSLFVLIARFFLSIWKSYNNWWVNVRYGITLFYIMNLLVLLAFAGEKMNVVVYMVLFAVGYLFITYYHSILNDKEYVENFELSGFWKKVCLTYMVISLLLLIYTFVFIVMA